MINVIDVDDSLVRLDSPILACAGLGESTGCTALLPRTSPAPINWSHDPLPPVKPRLDEDTVPLFTNQTTFTTCLSLPLDGG